ncbi:MAG TPA: 3,4-dihydroxy-2-butanone-4-phosphate synthase [Armatimonadota bacterium]|jgi:3,4-dihydroxy-2-butanone 4-phosphate synthase
MDFGLADMERAIQHFATGGMVLLLDDPGREGEADLLQAAQFCTGESLNFMITHARGLTTLATTAQRIAELDLPLIEPRHAPPHAPQFAVPVDYLHGTTSGVSAFDRAATIRAFTDPQARPEDFGRPGHVLPLAGSGGGLQARGGHTEGALGLAQLAQVYPAVVMCELMAADGRMATRDGAAAWAARHDVPLINVAQVAEALSHR